MAQYDSRNDRDRVPMRIPLSESLFVETLCTASSTPGNQQERCFHHSYTAGSARVLHVVPCHYRTT